MLEVNVMSCPCPIISHWHPPVRILQRKRLCRRSILSWMGERKQKVWIGLNWSPKNKTVNGRTRAMRPYEQKSNSGKPQLTRSQSVSGERAGGERERYLTSKLTTLLACHIVCWPRRATNDPATPPPRRRRRTKISILVRWMVVMRLGGWTD